MSTVTPSLMTTAEFMVLPEDGMERELIRGQLRERPMTKRNRFHASAVTRIARFLDEWIDQQPEPRGVVYTGEIGVILRHDPDTTVGIDVAYFTADVVSRQTEATTLIDGPPLLAVEVLSPSDRNEDVREKVLEYLAAGVAVVWIVDPYFRTVQVHRPGAVPEMFNTEHSLTGGTALPGLDIAVIDIFERRPVS